MRGRKPKPLELAEWQGNPGKRSLDASEAPVERLKLRAPDELDEVALQEWNRVAGLGISKLVVTAADRAVLAAYCMAYSRWMAAEKAIAELASKDKFGRGLIIKTSNGNVVQNPMVGVANKARESMARMASELGLTPVSRTRMNIKQSESPDDPFADIPDPAKLN